MPGLYMALCQLRSNVLFIVEAGKAVMTTRGIVTSDAEKPHVYKIIFY